MDIRRHPISLSIAKAPADKKMFGVASKGKPVQLSLLFALKRRIEEW